MPLTRAGAAARCDGSAGAIHLPGDGSYWEKDARGIELARVCPKCRKAKLNQYRPDVLTDANYWTTESIDPDT